MSIITFPMALKRKPCQARVQQPEQKNRRHTRMYTRHGKRFIMNNSAQVRSNRMSPFCGAAFGPNSRMPLSVVSGSQPSGANGAVAVFREDGAPGLAPSALMHGSLEQFDRAEHGQGFDAGRLSAQAAGKAGGEAQAAINAPGVVKQQRAGMSVGDEGQCACGAYLGTRSARRALAVVGDDRAGESFREWPDRFERAYGAGDPFPFGWSLRSGGVGSRPDVRRHMSSRGKSGTQKFKEAPPGEFTSDGGRRRERVAALSFDKSERLCGCGVLCSCNHGLGAAQGRLEGQTPVPRGAPGAVAMDQRNTLPPFDSQGEQGLQAKRREAGMHGDAVRRCIASSLTMEGGRDVARALSETPQGGVGSAMPYGPRGTGGGAGTAVPTPGFVHGRRAVQDDGIDRTGFGTA
jgi:hypothetical protein